ncbi:MAG: SufD family Fe-S cluster assembly protein, partial [Thermoplasmata archaeon]
MAGSTATAAWIDEQQVESLGRSTGEATRISEVRREALKRFRELPIEPNPLYRHYGYFYGVDLTGIDASSPGPRVPVPERREPGTILIVHDGAGTRATVSPDLASSGVRVETLPELLQDAEAPVDEGAPLLGAREPPGDRLTALSTAIVNRGYRLTVPDRWTEPVRIRDIVLFSRPHEALSVDRALRAGAGSQILYTEEVYATGELSEEQGQRFHGSSLGVSLRDDAKLVVLGVHAPPYDTVSYYRRRAVLGPSSRLAWIWIGLGGRATKARNETLLSGTGSRVHDLQTFYGDRRQSYDSSVTITHTGTDTQGESITRGVFTDEARGMSRGLVRIEREARKTISFISEHAML